MEQIKTVALDMDGVLTDGTFLWGANGEEMKFFSFRDIMGISLASRAGIIFALVSGEIGPLIDRYADKMKISFVRKSCKEKAAALREFFDAIGLPLENICFVGDDVNDLPALALAGFSAASSDAHPLILQAVRYVTRSGGGHDAVREIFDHRKLCELSI